MNNLDSLRAFHALAEVGNVTRAAERLGVTQPAVSKQLRQLERSLKTKLVQRRGRGVELTGEGQMLATYSRRVFALLDEAQSAIGDLQHLRSGSLSIGATTTFGVYVLPEALVRFRQRFPGIGLKLSVGNSQQLVDGLRDRSFDLAFAETLPPARDIDASLFMSDELLAIVPPDHRLAARKSVRASELVEEPFVVREAGSGTQSLVERVFAQHKLDIRPVLSLGSTEAVKRAVAAGLGVSIVSKLSIGAETVAGNLAALRLKDVQLRRPIYLLNRHGDRSSKATIAFLCLLKHVVRGTLPKIAKK